jgi:DNA polymerase III subunit beta
VSGRRKAARRENSKERTVKITIDREAWTEAVGACLPAVASGDIKQQLRHLHVRADEGGACAISATDLEIGVTVRTDKVKVEEPGDCLLPATALRDLLNAASVEELTIDADVGAAVVTGPGLSFNMPALDPATFPSIPGFDESLPHYEVDASTFARGLRRTVFAAGGESKTTVRYGAAMGVAFEPVAPGLQLVGTNGDSLAAFSVPGTAKGEVKKGVRSVPTTAVQVAQRWLTGGPAHVCLQENDALIHCGDLTVYARLLEGHFPQWRQIMPKPGKSPVKIEAGALLGAVRLAALVADDESRRLDLTFMPGILTIQAHDTERASRVEVPCEYAGPRVAAALKSRRLTAFLRVLAADEMLIIHVDKFVLFKVDDGYQCVVATLPSPVAAKETVHA